MAVAKTGFFEGEAGTRGVETQVHQRRGRFPVGGLRLSAADEKRFTIVRKMCAVARGKVQAHVARSCFDQPSSAPIRYFPFVGLRGRLNQYVQTVRPPNRASASPDIVMRIRCIGPPADPECSG